MNKSYDLFILGAGVTGCILAIELLRKNQKLKILMVDKRSSEQKRVGESCSDLTSIYLNLNIPKHILNKHTIKTGLRFLFSDGQEFASPSQKSTANGYQLNRAVFDKDLRDEAIRLGVEFSEETKVTSFHEVSTFNTKILLHSKDIEREIETKWFVDCSGRSRFLQKKFNWQDTQSDLSTASSWVHIKTTSDSWDFKELDKWNEKGIGPQDEATMHFLGKGYWAWYFPLEDKTSSLGLVYDKKILHNQKPRELFERILFENEHLKQIVGKTPVKDIHHLDELCYYPKKMFKEGFLTLGDASSFIDPLFSNGIESAIQQNLKFASLLGSYFRTNKFEENKWKATEALFIKSFKSRTLTFSTRYQVMHHFDIFTNWAQLDFFGYFSLNVIPSAYFPKIFLSNPILFNSFSLYIYKFFMKRYEKLAKLKDDANITRSVYPSKLIYSEAAVPQKKVIALLKSMQLFWLWFSHYIYLELKLFTGKQKARQQ